MDNIDKLSKKIESSKGYEAIVQLELLSLNFHVFSANYQQWRNYIDSLKSPDSFMTLWDFESRNESNLVLAELTRLLLNFLGSATSLVAVTRNSVPVWYQSTKFAQEYEVKKNEVKSTNESKFIEGLRNYSQHDKLPFITNQYSINMTEKKVLVGFILDRDILLRGDWKKEKGKDFLLNSEKEVDIEKIVESYYTLILEFHQWIFHKIQEINAKEIQITQAMQRELEKLLTEIFEQ